MTVYSFTVDSDKVIRIWNKETPSSEDQPFLIQPDFPDFTPWESESQATDWAEVFIAGLIDPESELVAGNSPDTHPAPRPRTDPEAGE